MKEGFPKQMKEYHNKFDPSPYMPKAKEILQKMTLKEKIGQLHLLGTVRNLDEDLVRSGTIGAFLNVPDVQTANRLQRLAVEESRLGIPLIIGHDMVHGDRTLFPVPLAGAASWDMERIENSERISAMETSAEGINWVYSPMIDISREPRWGRIAEGAGEDKLLGSAVAAARIRGFQSINPETGYPYVAACFKHYCGYGLSEAGRDYESCDISERTLHGEYLPVYKAAVEAGAMTCMSSFNSLNGIPVSGSRYYLTELLREIWGFAGFVVSDWTSVEELVNHRVAKDKKDAARRALLAGCDMDMHSGAYVESLEALAEEVPEILPAIDESVLRILCVKFAAGIFANPYRDEDTSNAFLKEEYRDTARDLAAHSMVLLKNKENILPLKRDKKKYLVTGPMADAQYEAMGVWGGRCDPATVITVRNALEREEGIETVYLAGCDFEGTDRAKFKEAARLAAGCDGIIFVCGEPCQWAGEGGGRIDIDLPDIQYEYLKLLKGLKKPLVSVLLTARPLACSRLDEMSDALLLGWHSGVEAGNAVRQLLMGDLSPSGRLPVTFPRATGQIPIYYASLSAGRPRSLFPRRYRDCPADPLYPFGYGLTYSTVVYDDITVENPDLHPGEELRASVTVSNTGDVAIEEVVQVYFCDVVSSIATPDKLLCDFEKISLEAGQTQKISFSIPADRFTFLNEKLEKVLEPGDFRLYIGADSTCEAFASFTVVE